MSGTRPAKTKLPLSSVNTFSKSRSWRLKSCTAAPICGTPSPLVTRPAIAPDNFTDTAHGAGRAAVRHTTPRTTLDTEMCVLVFLIRRRLAYHGTSPVLLGYRKLRSWG